MNQFAPFENVRKNKIYSKTFAQQKLKKKHLPTVMFSPIQKSSPN